MRRQPDRVILRALAAWMAILGLLLVIGTANLVAAESRLSTAHAAVRPAHPVGVTGAVGRGRVHLATPHRGAAGRTSAGRWSGVKAAVDRCLQTYGALMRDISRPSAMRSRQAVADRASTTGLVCGQVARTTAAIYRHEAGASHPEVLWLSHLAQTVTIDMQRLHRAALSHRSWRQTADAVHRLARNFTSPGTYRAREGRWMRRLTAA